MDSNPSKVLSPLESKVSLNIFDFENKVLVLSIVQVIIHFVTLCCRSGPFPICMSKMNQMSTEGRKNRMEN